MNHAPPRPPTEKTTTQDLRAWRAAAPAGHPLLTAADAALARSVHPPPPAPAPQAPVTVTALLFAAACDAVGGARSVRLALPPGSTAADAVAALADQYPHLHTVLGACAVAVNCEVVGPAVEEEGGGGGGGVGGVGAAAATLSPGDEVALIPPISGG
jgi:molybdopterin converting factor small subunit